MARLVPDIVDADDGAAGLLIECRGWDEECLKVGLAMLALCCAVLCCGCSETGVHMTPDLSTPLSCCSNVTRKPDDKSESQSHSQRVGTQS